MEAIHVKSLYYMLSFIVLHIGGVLLADIGSEPGIVSKMIRGDFKNEDVAHGHDHND